MLTAFFMRSSLCKAGEKKDHMNIVLIGYRCSGKSTVGKIIAKKLKRDFLDTDVMIEEEAGSSIEEIISIDGWEHFREVEKCIIKTVSGSSNLVLATGGGIVMDVDNVKNLKKGGFIVWLRGDIDVLRARMEKDHRSGNKRPSLTGEDPVKEIRKVLDIRDPLYSQAGDFVVDTSCLSLQEVADSIINEVQRIGIGA